MTKFLNLAQTLDSDATDNAPSVKAVKTVVDDLATKTGTKVTMRVWNSFEPSGPSTPGSTGYSFGDRYGDVSTIVGEYEDGEGKKYAFAVLDAQYRTNGPTWGDNGFGFTSGLPNYTSAGAVLAGTESATYNTNHIIENFGTRCQAFNAARKSFEINGGTVLSHLPNAYELKEIWNKRVELDTFDPTLNTYSKYSLADWSFGDGLSEDIITNVWCSNQVDNGRAWYINANGSFATGDKYYNLAVIPVIEIPLN